MFTLLFSESRQDAASQPFCSSLEQAYHEPDQDHNDQHWYAECKRHQDSVHQKGICRDTDTRAASCLDPSSPYQETMGIDAVGCTGHQGTVIFSIHNGQFGQVAWKDDPDLIHFIGQDLIQNVHDKGITVGQLVQVGKEPGAGETSVAGYNAVASFSSHREARALQMADGCLKSTFFGTMVDGQDHIDPWDLDIPHDTGPAYVQQVIVFLFFLFCQRPSDSCLGDLRIICLCFPQYQLVFVIVDMGDHLCIAGHSLR